MLTPPAGPSGARYYDDCEHPWHSRRLAEELETAQTKAKRLDALNRYNVQRYRELEEELAGLRSAFREADKNG